MLAYASLLPGPCDQIDCADADTTWLTPVLRVLYLSGYTDDATAVQGGFWGGVPLLQKPSTPGQLAERVRMALDAPATRS